MLRMTLFGRYGEHVILSVSEGPLLSTGQRCLGLMLLVLLAGCNGSARMPQFLHLRGVRPLSDQVRAAIRVVNDGGKVAVSEALVIELKLANVSEKDAAILNDLAPGWSVVIEIAGADGRYVRSISPALPPVKLPSGSHYVALPPRGFVGAQYLVRPTDPMWKLSTGRYIVRVVYRNKHALCPASPLFTIDDIERIGDKSVVRVLTGMIVSNAVEFEVVKD